MQSEHLAKIVHAKFQVNAAIFVGAKPKKVGKKSFLQYFTVFKKKIATGLVYHLHELKEGHFLISKPVVVMVEHFLLKYKSLPNRLCSVHSFFIPAIP